MINNSASNSRPTSNGTSYDYDNSNSYNPQSGNSYNSYSSNYGSVSYDQTQISGDNYQNQDVPAASSNVYGNGSVTNSYGYDQQTSSSYGYGQNSYSQNETSTLYGNEQRGSSSSTGQNTQSGYEQVSAENTSYYGYEQSQPAQSYQSQQSYGYNQSSNSNENVQSNSGTFSSANNSAEASAQEVEDFGFGNTALKKNTEPAKKNTEPAQNSNTQPVQNSNVSQDTNASATTVDTPTDNPDSSKSSLISMISSPFTWLSRRPTGNSGGAAKPESSQANLGKQNSMIYDKNLKRWIVPGAPVEEKKDLPPPPPMGSSGLFQVNLGSVGSMPPSSPALDSRSQSPAIGSSAPSTPNLLGRSSTTVRKSARSKYVDILNPDSAMSTSSVNSFIPTPQFSGSDSKFTVLLINLAFYFKSISL